MAYTKVIGEGFEGGLGWKPSSLFLVNDPNHEKFILSSGDGNLSLVAPISPSVGVDIRVDDGTNTAAVTRSPIGATNFVSVTWFVSPGILLRMFKYTPLIQAIETSHASRDLSTVSAPGKEQFKVVNKAGDSYLFDLTTTSGWVVTKNGSPVSTTGTNAVNRIAGFNDYFLRVYRSGNDLKFVFCNQLRDIVTYIDVGVASDIDIVEMCKPSNGNVDDLTVWTGDAAQVSSWEANFGTNDFRAIQHYMVEVDVRAAPDGNTAKTTNGTTNSWIGSDTNAFDDMTDGDDLTTAEATTDQLGFEQKQTYEDTAARTGLTVGKITSKSQYFHRISDDDAELFISKLKNGVSESEISIQLPAGSDGFASAFFGEGDPKFDSLNILPTTNGVIMTGRRAAGT